MHRSTGIAPFLLGLAAAVAVAGCGGGESETTPVADTGQESTVGDQGGSESILIKTDVKIDIPEGGPVAGATIGKGEVLGGSSIADSPFCSGGTFRDQHGDDPAIGLVLRTFDCPDGSLKMGFTPGPPTTPLIQEGPWRVLEGTGGFEDLQGAGQMEIRYEPGTQGTEGGETFTGEVSR